MVFEHDTLRLVALTPDQLRAFDERPAELLAELGVGNPEFFNPDFLREITQGLLWPRLQTTPPQDYILYTKWLAIDTAARRVVADLLIKQGPDREGAIEIGYGVYPDCEGKGYTTRMVAAFLAWARTERRIARIWAETEKDNIASIKVLEKNGFRRTREQEGFVYWERMNVLPTPSPA